MFGFLCEVFIFGTTGKLLTQQQQLQGFRLNESIETKDSNEVFSMFPVENEELLYTRWEDKIIWDATVSVALMFVSVLVVPAFHNELEFTS